MHHFRMDITYIEEKKKVVELHMKQNRGRQRTRMETDRQLRDSFHFQVMSGFTQSRFQSAALPKHFSVPLTAHHNNTLITLSKCAPVAEKHIHM